MFTRRFTRKFRLERETKNMLRYQEEVGEEKEMVGLLYIKKDAFGEERPEFLILEIKEEVETGE